MSNQIKDITCPDKCGLCGKNIGQSEIKRRIYWDARQHPDWAEAKVKRPFTLCEECYENVTKGEAENEQTTN